MEPIVSTKLGKVRGREEGALCVFRGIPFAQPPVGNLRLRPPQPLEPWDGVLDAAEFSAAPPQSVDGMVQRLGLLGEHEFSEDCLYLNVWTPGLDDARRPVLVWIHGGAFMNGTGAAPIYDGTPLATRGDVVIVSMNYRVGFLGFSCFEGESNLGLLDQIAVLEWVRDEIASFGGDPEQVTVFGESAGAGSITALLAMPAARGLFRRAVIQSPAVTGMITAEEAAARTAKMCEKLGLAEATIEAAQQAPIERILEAQRECLAEGPYTAGMYFVPVVDGTTLPRMPLDAIAEGAARDVEVMIGTTVDELQLYALALGTANVNEERLRRVAARLAPGAASNGDVLIEAYHKARAARGEGVGPADLYHAITTDERMRLPSIALAEAQARHQPRTYMYLFTWRSPMDGGALGSCHALDLPFTFGTLDAKGMDEFAGNGPEAWRLSERMMDAWLAFARSGNPSHAGIGEWPPFDASRRATMILGTECGAVDAPLEAERAIWGQLSAS